MAARGALRVAGGVAGALACAYAMYGLWALIELSTLLTDPPIAPADVIADAARAADAKVIVPIAADGTRGYGWHRRAAGTRAVLYFHGTGDVVYSRYRLQEAYLQSGFDTVFVTYRGYPGADPVPLTEAGLGQDARAAWAAVMAAGFAPDQVVVHGKSLGGWPATLIAAEYSPAGLILESTLTDAQAVAADRHPLLPVRWLLPYALDILSLTDGVQCPTLVLHGADDTAVRPHHGRALAQALGARYIESDGVGHGQDLVLEAVDARSAWRMLLEQVVP